MGVSRPNYACAAALVTVAALFTDASAQTTPDTEGNHSARVLLHEAMDIGRALPSVERGSLAGRWAMERRPVILTAVAEALSRVDQGENVRTLIEQALKEEDALQSYGNLGIAQNKVNIRVSLALALFRVGDEQGARALLASVESTDPRAPGTYANVYGPAAVESRVRLSDVWLEAGDRSAALAALREAETAVMNDDAYQYAFVAREMASRGFVAEAAAIAARIAAEERRAVIQTGSAGTPLALAQLAIAEGKLKLGDSAGAVAAVRGAIDGSRRQCRAPSFLGRSYGVLRRAGESAGADDLWRELVASARLISDGSDRASELACLAGLRESDTDKTEALALIDEAVAMIEPLSSPRERAFALTHANTSRILLGERDAATGALREELGAAQRIRDRPVRFAALVRVSRGWIQLERTMEARSVLAEALASASDPNSLVTFGRDHRLVAELQISAGDLDGALATTRLITEPSVRALALVGLANALLGMSLSDEGIAVDDR